MQQSSSLWTDSCRCSSTRRSNRSRLRKTDCSSASARGARIRLSTSEEPMESNDEPTPEAIHEEVQRALSPDEITPHADRFYDRLRDRIRTFLASKANLGPATEFLMFAPDVFVLLVRLAKDDRVTGKNKVLLGSGMAYFIFPLDIVPEAIVGPIGYLDDLVFSVYILNKILTETDEQVLHDNWSGSGNVLDMMRSVLQSADKLVARDALAKIKKM